MRTRVPTLNLTRRVDGMWCKKIAGRIHYFGQCGCDEATARLELIEFLKSQQAGTPPPRGVLLTLGQLSGRYGAVSEARVAGGTLQDRTWKGYKGPISEFIELTGANVLVRDLGADHFAKVARNWRAFRGVNRTDNDIQAVRTMFRWAFENGIIDRTPIYGKEFSKAAASAARIERYNKHREAGERRFTDAEVAKLLAGAKGKMRAMILLALNGGMYSVDIADLKWDDLKRSGKRWIIDTTRHKTGIPRRLVLWPETLKAVQSLERTGPIMLTTYHGNAWNNRRGTDSIGLMFRRFRRSIGVDRAGVGFGSFRHTHVSAVNDHPDQAAARLVRAHQVQGIERHYDFPSIERVASVCALARSRLLKTKSAETHRPRVASSSRPPKSRRRAGASAA